MKKRRKLILVAAVLALVASAFPLSQAFAATTQTVTITATPTYLCLTLVEYDNGGNDGDWVVGTVAENTDGYWWDDEGAGQAAPGFPMGVGNCSGNISTDCSSVAQDIDIKATNFTGGGGWTLAGSPGVDDVTLKAGNSTAPSEGGMLTLTTNDQEIFDGLAANSNGYIELHLATGTFGDGDAKTSTVTITATADT